jgi:hypothetical protein
MMGAGVGGGRRARARAAPPSAAAVTQAQGRGSEARAAASETRRPSTRPSSSRRSDAGVAPATRAGRPGDPGGTTIPSRVSALPRAGIPIFQVLSAALSSDDSDRRSMI